MNVSPTLHTNLAVGSVVWARFAKKFWPAMVVDRQDWDFLPFGSIKAETPLVVLWFNTETLSMVNYRNVFPLVSCFNYYYSKATKTLRFRRAVSEAIAEVRDMCGLPLLERNAALDWAKRTCEDGSFMQENIGYSRYMTNKIEHIKYRLKARVKRQKNFKAAKPKEENISVVEMSSLVGINCALKRNSTYHATSFSQEGFNRLKRGFERWNVLTKPREECEVGNGPDCKAEFVRCAEIKPINEETIEMDSTSEGHSSDCRGDEKLLDKYTGIKSTTEKGRNKVLSLKDSKICDAIKEKKGKEAKVVEEFQTDHEVHSSHTVKVNVENSKICEAKKRKRRKANGAEHLRKDHAVHSSNKVRLIVENSKIFEAKEGKSKETKEAEDLQKDHQVQIKDEVKVNVDGLADKGTTVRRTLQGEMKEEGKVNNKEKHMEERQTVKDQGSNLKKKHGPELRYLTVVLEKLEEQTRDKRNALDEMDPEITYKKKSSYDGKTASPHQERDHRSEVPVTCNLDVKTVAPARTEVKAEEGSARTSSVDPNDCVVAFASHIRSDVEDQPLSRGHSQLLLHRAFCHTPYAPATCTLCKKHVASRAPLKGNHLKRSVGLKFRCGECGQRFRKRTTLWAHLCSHLDSPYVPSMPLLTSTVTRNWMPFDFDNVRDHFVGERCEVCGKAFASATNLKSHMKSHSTAQMGPKITNCVVRLVKWSPALGTTVC